MLPYQSLAGLNSSVPNAGKQSTGATDADIRAYSIPVKTVDLWGLKWETLQLFLKLCPNLLM